MNKDENFRRQKGKSMHDGSQIKRICGERTKLHTRVTDWNKYENCLIWFTGFTDNHLFFSSSNICLKKKYTISNPRDTQWILNNIGYLWAVPKIDTC